jgi:hypothetical protein
MVNKLAEIKRIVERNMKDIDATLLSYGISDKHIELIAKAMDRGR